MRRFLQWTGRFREGLSWALVALLLVTSVLDAIARSHAPTHDNEHAVVACVHEAPQPPGLGSLFYDLAHAWHTCGVVMAVLPMPVAKLLQLPSIGPPNLDVLAAVAPMLQRLFRPPNR